jgi:PAS domain S-box-containing protein
METEEVEALSPEAIRKVVHELRVHQVELETQNEDLRQTREELDLSRQRYFDLYDLAPVGYCTVSEKGLVLEANLTAATLLGKVRSTLVKQPFSRFIHHEDADNFYHYLRRLFNTGRPDGVELRMRRDGSDSSFWARLEATVAEDGDGPALARVVMSDVSERRRHEEALRESEANFRALAENSTAATFIVQGEKFVYLNTTFIETSGYALGDLDTVSFWELLGPELRDEIKARAQVRQEHNDRTPKRYEVKVISRSGTEKILDVSVAGIEFNKKPAILGVAMDITDRKKAEELLELKVRERTRELEEAHEKLIEETSRKEHVEHQLRQAQKMEALGTLTGGIAHDFNNILAAIVGFTELAADRAAKGSMEERYAKRVLQAGLRGRNLARQMLAFSRKTEEEEKPLQMGTVLLETLDLLKATTPSTIGIKTEIAKESGLIYGDPVHIQQLFMNLCTNAIHAMRDSGGVLDIALSDVTVPVSDGRMEPGPYARLVVSDTGVGMAPEVVDKIFDPFFTTKGPGEGTGLGLSVVHGIVSHSNGVVFVESEPGKGSTFTVYLPEIAGEGAPETHEEAAIPTGSERILLVDDEEALVEVGKDILAELGYQVTSRTSGRDAVALLKEDPSRFDLIITDVTMPEMTGIDLARGVLAIRPDMPVIVCTGYSHLVDADKAKAAGIRAFAMKPLTKREIAKTIRRVLDK